MKQKRVVRNSGTLGGDNLDFKSELHFGPSNLPQRNVIPPFNQKSFQPHPQTMSASKSRWADEDPETEAIIAQKKREKEEKRRAKAEKQRQLEEASKAQTATQTDGSAQSLNGDSGPPTKRRRLSNDRDATTADADVPESEEQAQKKQASLLRFPVREWGTCRHVDNFERLNHIEEGSYGWVSRAKDITTGEVVALKKLKIQNSPDGFPVTGLREIQTLLEARHQNVVFLREVVMGNQMDE